MIEGLRMRKALLKDEGAKSPILDQIPDEQAFQEQLLSRVVTAFA